MPQQTLTITVDVPEGYEAVDFRRPLCGEVSVPIDDTFALPETLRHPAEIGTCHLILRRVWTPPAWLPEGCWVWKSIYYAWCASRNEPQESASGSYYMPDGVVVICTALAHLHNATFEPPPTDKIQVRHTPTAAGETR